MPTPPNPTIHPLHQHTQPLSTHNTTLLVHRAPQLIADPAPNPLLGHHMTQSHVQISHLVRAPETGRYGAAESIFGEPPDATAQRAHCDDTSVFGVLDVDRCVCEINAYGRARVCWGRSHRSLTQEPADRHPRTIAYMPTLPNPMIYPLHQITQPSSTHTTTQHNTTLLAIAPRSATHRRPCFQSRA